MINIASCLSFQMIGYEGFKCFMDLYLDMDISESLCTHLFASFIKRRPSHTTVVKNNKEHFDLKGKYSTVFQIFNIHTVIRPTIIFLISIILCDTYDIKIRTVHLYLVFYIFNKNVYIYYYKFFSITISSLFFKY